MNHINLKVPVVNDRIHLLWPFERSEAISFLKSIKMNDCEVDEEMPKGTGSCVFGKEKGQGAVIFLKDWNESIDDYTALFHEVTHATAYILHDKGVKENREVPEMSCYLGDWIFRQLLIRLRKRD